MPGEGGQPIDRSGEVLERLEELEIDAVVTIGGDGSMRIAARLLGLGVGLVGVPKTIDNDLQATDLSFGFDSALHVATEAIDRLHTTAESHHRVMLVEVMGRHAGWIALEAGLAGGADVILIPEIPYRLEEIARAVVQRARSGRKFSIVVVSEGALPVGGQPTYRHGAAGAPRLGGVCDRVAGEIALLSGAETRATVLGHLQRGGSPSPLDRVLGTRFGAAAVHLIARGELGRMVALHGTQIVDVPIAEAIARPKLVDAEGELVRTACSVGISFGT
jgi:6-phosphofructokinase 1